MHFYRKYIYFCENCGFLLSRSQIFWAHVQISVIQYNIVQSFIAQCLTNCNTQFQLFLVQKNVLYNISKVSVSLVRGKCFLSPKSVIFGCISFGDHSSHSNSVLDDCSSPMEQHDAYLVSIALSVQKLWSLLCTAHTYN